MAGIALALGGGKVSEHYLASVQEKVSPLAMAGWSETLQFIAEGVTKLAGFGVAAISVVGDDKSLHAVAVAGSDEAREMLRGRGTPIEQLNRELANADDWGVFKFVPHERLELDTEVWGWVPDAQPIDDPDAWHPLDLLIAPLFDDEGLLRGTLAIDLPADGRRPSARQREMLEVYAEQANRAVLTALEREALAERVRLADAARRIVRNASKQLSMERVLEECREALIEGFGAAEVWIQTFDEDGDGSGSVSGADGTEVRLPPEVVRVAEAAARRAWKEQRTYAVTRGRHAGDLSDDQLASVLAFLEEAQVTAVLVVPLGAGPECVGNLVLTRKVDGAGWTEAEAATALDIGHDLGRAILNARTFEREHQLVCQLQELDEYKSQLIATVSHELKNPLAAILGHLEMLDGKPDLDAQVRRSLATMDRAGRRVFRVVDDLLTLAKMEEPDRPVLATPVDLREVVQDAVELNGLAAVERHLTVLLNLPEGQTVTTGDADELDRVVCNLVSNAIKYTPEGGTITLSLFRAHDEVVFACQDDGIGISAEDQAKLFTEFFRSSNPEAVAQPGTGLGLAIVARVVARHGGRIEVDSNLGTGSTFRIYLPAG